MGKRGDESEATETSAGTDETLPPSSPFGGADVAPNAFRAVDDADYVIVSELARGGMGRIRHARDRRHDRPVAIKELLKGTPEARERFRREALITARLQHPAIVPLYEAGTWPSGEPFYSMKLVEGDSLDKVIARSATLAERIALLPRVTIVAEAIAYAHERRIIHRDLKPSNILVGDLGETVVIDWGLAKDLGERERSSDGGSDAELAASSAPTSGALTVAGRTMGTPAYMPPEQAQGNDVDERADVYALGAVLYHLLAGRPPYSEAKSVPDLLAALRAGPPAPLGTKTPDVPRDLLTIVEKAMARDRDDRYPRARELAADLRRFEAGQLVGAHTYSSGEIFRRWIRRHRGIVIVIAIAAVLAAVGAAVSFRRVARERDTATRFARASELARRDADDRVEQLSLERARAVLSTDPTRALELARAVPAASRWAPLAQLTATVAEIWGVSTALWRGDDLGAMSLPPDGATMAWTGEGKVWFRDADGATVSHPIDATASVLTFARDGKTFAMGTRAGDVFYGQSKAAPVKLGAITDRVQRLDLEHPGLVIAMNDDELAWWDVTANPPRLVRPDATQPATFTGIARDDRIVVVGKWGVPEIWSRSGARLVTRLDGYQNSWTRQSGEVTPDGEHLLYLSNRDELLLLDLARGTTQRLGDLAGVRTVKIWVGTVGDDRVVVDILGGVHVWPSDGGGRDTIAPPSTGRDALAVERVGATIAISFDNGDITIVDPRRGPLRTLHGHVGEVFALRTVVTGDTTTLISAGRDSTIRRWQLDAPNAATTIIGHRPVTAVAVTRDGVVVAAGENGVVHLWEKGAPPRPIARDVLVNQMALSPDDRYLVWAHARRVTQGGVGLLDLSDRDRRSELAGCSKTPVFAQGAPRFACVRAYDGAVILWDTATWTSVAVGLAGAEQVDSLALSPDGRRVASGRLDAEFGLQWWDVSTDKRRVLSSGKGNVWSVVFRPDATSLVSVNGAREVIAWQPAAGRSATLGIPAAAARQLVGGTQLVVAGGEDGTVTVWDLERTRMRQLRPIGADGVAVEQLALTSDETVIVVRYRSGLVSLWDVASGAGIPLPGTFDSVALSSDGRQLVGGRKTGEVVRMGLPASSGPRGDEGWASFAITWKDSEPVIDAATAKIEKRFERGTANPTDGKEQRQLGDMLTVRGRTSEALAFYRRGADLGDGLARWRLAIAEAHAAPASERARLVLAASIRVASEMPWDDTSTLPLKYVLAAPDATLAQKVAVLERWLAAAGKDPERLNELAYVAIRGGALDVAQRAVDRLLVVRTDAPHLDTAAEVAHWRGDRAAAVALSERAVAMKPDDEELRANLRRFRRGDAEPALTEVERLPPLVGPVTPARIDVPKSVK